MNRSQLQARVARAWTTFTDSYAGLDDSELLVPGVTGDWSVRDIIAHVATWEEEALTHLPLIMRGGRPPRYSTTHGGIDAFNARTTGEKEGLSLAEVLEHQADTHRRLVEFIDTVPASQFKSETRFRRRLRLDTYGHYPLHAEAVRNWRSRR